MNAGSPSPGDKPRSGVMVPGAGDISTVGPVHLERRATTSARRDRSVNAALGCDLICRQAASQGIVSVVVSGSDMSNEEVMDGAADVDDEPEAPADAPRSLLARPHRLGFPQQPLPTADEQVPPPFSERQGQSLHGEVQATVLLIAAQNALPNASSAHAGQFEGSPVHEGTSGFGGSGVGMVIGKMGCSEGLWVRRRSGMGGW